MKHSTLFGRSRLATLLCVGAMGFAAQAHALTIDALNLAPTWQLDTNYWTSNETSALGVGDVESLVGFTGLGEAYKIDYDNTAEGGTAASYYSTTFSGDPNDATITQSGGMYIVCGDCYLVVKDGKSIPAVYAFNISGWNGVDSINLTNFWNGPGGAISYVGIYNNYSMEDGGGNIAMVPEAETYAMMLAGLGLVGFAAARRRRS